MVREERGRKGEATEWRYNSWFQRCAHRRCFFHKGVGNSSWVVVVLVDALGLIRLDKRDIMCALVGQVHHAGGAASAAAGGGGGEGGGHRAPQADHRRHARASGRLMVPSRPFRVPCVVCHASNICLQPSAVYHTSCMVLCNVPCLALCCSFHGRKCRNATSFPRFGARGVSFSFFFFLISSNAPDADREHSMLSPGVFSACAFHATSLFF